MIDPRANSHEKLTAPKPLPFISRRALKRIKHPSPIPTSCDLCQSSHVELVENSEVYGGRTYGYWPYVYLCRDCGARVGLHSCTDIPLGTMADQALRKARKDCKEPFEKIWQSDAMNRDQAYQWLAKNLGISIKYCHFGLFNIEQCLRARELCEQYLLGMAQGQPNRNLIGRR